MRKRTRKVLSLLIAASMVCAMNTAAFAEEAVDIEAAPAEEDMIEIAVDDSAAIEAEAAVEAGAAVDGIGEADDGAAVDEADDAAVDAETDDASSVSYIYGLAYKDGKCLADITYASNGDKKNPKNDVVTIKNTTNPVSWNNFNANSLLYTVLFGENETAEHLNYTSTVTASKNRSDLSVEDSLGEEIEIPAGWRGDTYEYKYFVEPIENGSAYLLIGYRLYNNSMLKLVDDENGKSKLIIGNNEEWLAGIPLTSWDGRKIDYNKSGHHKYTTGKKELIDVGVSIVTYNNGTVTELPGVSVKSVKVDKKNQKKASVAYRNKVVSENLLSWSEAGDKLETVVYSAIERDKISDLPYFTFTADIKGSNAKTYKKDVNKILKDKKFYFGIAQNGVSIDFSNDSEYNRLEDILTEAVLSGNLIDNKGKDRSAYEEKIDGSQCKITISSDTAPIEKKIAELIANESYFDSDVDSMIIDGGYMRISKFNGKKAVINERGWVGDDKKGEFKDLGTLKVKKDYTIDTTGSIAGTTVNILDFPAGGNYVYADYLWYDWDPNRFHIYDAGDVEYGPVDMYITADALGYKYAFRKSPDEKSKKFRGGIYAADNTGFVYETE